MPWVVLLVAVGVTVLGADWLTGVLLGLALLPFAIIWHLSRRHPGGRAGDSDRFVRDLGDGGA